MRLTASATALVFLWIAACGPLVGIPPEAQLEADDASVDHEDDAGIDVRDGSTPLDSTTAADTSAPPFDASEAGDGAAHDVDASDAAPDPDALCVADVINDWTQNPPAIGLGSPQSVASYDAIIKPLMQEFHVPGGAIAVVRDGKLVLARGYGYSDRGTFTFAHPDAMFRMASITKQITSAAILVMVQKGLVSLDDKAFPILSNLTPLAGQTQNPQLASISIRNLLQHSGGWNSDVERDPMFQPTAIALAAAVQGPPDCNTIIRYMLSRPLTYSPGTTFDYSNFGYCVLGAVVEKVTGTKFETWVDANVLAPLHAQGLVTGHTFREQRLEEEAVYEDYPGDGLAATAFPNGPPLVPWQYGGFDLEAMWADGAWVGSPIDFLRFQAGLEGRVPGTPALLNASSIAALIANPGLPTGNSSGGTDAPNPDYWYGLGWQLNSWENWWHTGALPGSATLQVRGAPNAHGVQGAFGWAAFFNTRPQDGAFFGRLDDGLWTAHDNAGTWATRDFFEEYAPPFTPWMTFAEYQQQFSAQAQIDNFPTHVEGATQSGVSKFRARFGPAHGAGFNAIHNADCLTYKADKALYESQGETLVSLQSFVDSEGNRKFQAVWTK